MYHVTPNQKEQLLWKILAALEPISEERQTPAREFLLKMYLRVQNLKPGGSLQPEEAKKLKRLLRKKKR